MAVLKVNLLCLLLILEVTHKTFDTYTVIALFLRYLGGHYTAYMCTVYAFVTF